MANWFASIGQAASGVDAARYGLTVVSQNISNADTDGYTRETAQQVSVDPTVSAGLYTTRGTNLAGGTSVASVDRMVDPVLDARVRNEQARGAAADTTSSFMSGLEQLLPDPGTTGVSADLNSFWAAWGSLANNPNDSGVRATVLSDASQTASDLNGLAGSLDDLATSTATSLAGDVDQAQTAATNLGTLNEQIALATATGQNANNLLDQRDQLLTKLSTLVGGVATIAANGSASVAVGGQTLVSGSTVGTLAVSATNSVTVNGTAVTLTGGSAASRVSALTSTLPTYRAQLDAVANTLVTAGNAVQQAGYDSTGAQGAALFGGSGAAGISVVLTDAGKLAASSTSGTLDGGNAALASQRGTTTDGPDAAYRSLVAGVASASSRSQQAQTTQDAVVSNVNSLRASVSGVSYDDEITQLLTYQHAFQASSRVLTTVDSMLDTLINHTGAGA